MGETRSGGVPRIVPCNLPPVVIGVTCARVILDCPFGKNVTVHMMNNDNDTVSS
jgi:hypothetical protein